MRRFLHLLWLLSVVTLLLVAVVLGAARLWVPSLADYRHEVEQAAGGVLGQPVSIGVMQATWRGVHPVLKLKDVVIGAPDAGQPPLRVKEIWMRLDVAPYLRNREIRFSGLDIIGTDVVLVRDSDGMIVLENFHGGGDYEWLAGMERLSIHESSITLRDVFADVEPLRFSSVMLALTSEGDTHYLTGHAWLPADVGYRLELAARFTGGALALREWRGRAYLKGQQLSLSPLLRRWLPHQSLQGITDLSLWVDVDAARVAAVSAELYVDDARVEQAAGDQLHVFSADALAVQLGWRTAENGWQGALRLLAADHGGRQWQPFELSLSGSTAAGGVYLGARQLLLDEVWQLLPFVPGLEPALLNELVALEPSGLLSGLEVMLQRTGDQLRLQDFRARFDDVGLAQTAAFPFVAGLDGSIAGSPGSGALTLDSRALDTTDTRIFRDVLTIDELQGVVHWSHTAEGLRVESDHLVMANPDMALQTSFVLALPDGEDGPRLDLEAEIESLNVGRVSHYLPAKVMSPTGVAWLDRSLLGGEVRGGSVRIHGRLDRLPFDDGEGQLEVRLPVHGATLDFNEDWTPVTQLDAQVDFTGRAMDIVSRSGRIRTATLHSVRARISDLANPYLTIDGTVRGPLPVMLAELGSSPLGEEYGGFVDRAITSGRCELRLDIDIPLKERHREVKVAGHVHLRDNTLKIRDSDIELTGIAGELAFDDKGIRGEGLRATLFGHPAEVQVRGDADSGGTRVRLSGKLALLDRVLDEGSPLRKAVTGDSDWEVLLTMRGSPARGKSADIGLRISSSLDGTAVDLPPPLGKPAGEPRPLILVVDDAERALRQVSLVYGDALKGKLQLASDARGTRLKRGTLTLGGGEPALPDSAGLLINGALAALSVSDWQPWLQRGQAGPAVAVRLDLAIGELEVLGYLLDELHLAAGSSGRVWNVTASGESARGEIELTQGGGGLEKVVMNMQRLALNRVDDAQAGSGTRLTPADMPALQVTVGELVYRGANFGQLDLRADVQTANRLVVDHLALSSDLLSMRMSGEWRVTGAAQLSRVALEVTGGRIDRLLEVLGYEKVFRKGDLYGSLQASWPGAPWEVSPEVLDGKFNVLIKDGQLLDIEPGATGRTLGLLRLGLLPRRLTLDFSDLFGEGFAFDRIAGNFVLDGGNAYTTDLVIDGPAAKIEISGRVGLADEDYDELVTVTPYLSSSLPLAGALAGGPAVGAAVIIADKLLGDRLGLNKMARKQYTVTGPWEAPEVKRIDTGSADEEAAPDDEDF